MKLTSGCRSSGNHGGDGLGAKPRHHHQHQKYPAASTADAGCGVEPGARHAGEASRFDGCPESRDRARCEVRCGSG